ncbi:MAG: hypothetical protein ABWY06_20900 [Pseudomonas sp.]|uniref:hypothetical protein n=1 Tax=Pseudomonas sp. TaxID=306 RepID=UPI0033946623
MKQKALTWLAKLAKIVTQTIFLKQSDAPSSPYSGAASMTFRTSLNYAELPASLKATVGESDFLKAYNCPDSGSVVAWIINRSLGRQQELEFSLSLSRLLSPLEREQALPEPVEVAVPGLDVSVIKTYRLDQCTDVRYETYTIYSKDLQAQIATCEQVYFLPALTDVADMVRQAVESATFPATYGGWTLPEQVNHWVYVFYRIRHQAGETGAHEDVIFSIKLIEKMKETDLNIEQILPFIIKGLATMESIDPVELTKSFNRRTGLNIAP